MVAGSTSVCPYPSASTCTPNRSSNWCWAAGAIGMNTHRSNWWSRSPGPGGVASRAAPIAPTAHSWVAPVSRARAMRVPARNSGSNRMRPPLARVDIRPLRPKAWYRGSVLIEVSEGWNQPYLRWAWGQCSM